MAYDPSQRKKIPDYPSVFSRPPRPGSSIGRAFFDPKYGGGFATFSGAVSPTIPDLPPAGINGVSQTNPQSIPPMPGPSASDAASPVIDVSAEVSPITPQEPPQNIVPFAQDSGELQGPPIPPITQQIQMEHQRHLDFIAQQHAQLDTLDNPDAVPEAAPPEVPGVAVPTAPRSVRPAQFVSSGNKPQWSDVLGGGEQDHLYDAYPTAGKSHVYAPSTERFYKRALDRFDKTKSPSDARRVNRYNARISNQNG